MIIILQMFFTVYIYIADLLQHITKKLSLIALRKKKKKRKLKEKKKQHTFKKYTFYISTISYYNQNYKIQNL